VNRKYGVTALPAINGRDIFDFYLGRITLIRCQEAFMSDLSPEPIIQVASGYMAAKQLFIAVEIGLFERLAEGAATIDELGQRAGIPRRTLRIVTDAMVALGLVERTDDRYRNSASAVAFLAGSGPDLRPFLRLLNSLSYPRWGHVRGGRTNRSNHFW